MTRLRRILDALTHTGPGPGYDPWAHAHGEEIADIKTAHEAHRAALSEALDLGTSAPWDAILDRAATAKAAAAVDWQDIAAQREHTLGRVRALRDRWAKALGTDRAYAHALNAALDPIEPAEHEPHEQPTPPEPAPCAGCTGCGGPDCLELTAQEAREVAADLSIQLYRAQDATAFVREMCDTADRQGQQVTTTDVRAWLDGPKCARQAGLVIDPAPAATNPALEEPR